MKHLDLFSGIGGFAIAVDEVWPGSEHIFCDNDKFCQAVLKKHWPQSKIYGDIRALHADGFDTNPDIYRRTAGEKEINTTEANKQTFNNSQKYYGKIDIITGGFPCQPFSQSGRRKGTADDRYLWPEMLRVIREFSPSWVIAENVRGLLTLQQGVVFEQVCSDLEASGYEVQPIIIPAVAVNAPHRRDRVWFIAHRASEGLEGCRRKKAGPTNSNRDIKNTKCERRGGGLEDNGQILESGCSKVENERPDWERNWIEVATELCQLDDEFSTWLDRCFDDVIQLNLYESIKKNKGKDLSYLWKEIQSSQVWEKIRGLFKIFEQKDLLSILRKLEIESERQKSISSKSEEIQEKELRNMWYETEFRCSPQRREYQKQCAKKLADSLPLLPYESALEIAEIWDYISLAYSSDVTQPVELDGLKLSKAGHRNAQLKAYGNAIVPQVAIEIMKSIKSLINA